MLGMYGLLVALSVFGQTPDNFGVIEGHVINTSQDNRPVAEAEVILQVRIDGEFQAVEKTVSDQQGRFRFDKLPVGLDLVYLPGANRDEIHYPGRRIELTSRRSNAYLTIPVRDAITEPNPLIIRELEIVIRGEPGVLHVVEAMLIDNPGSATYVGKQVANEMMPTTLALGITSEFERLTFEQEAFGRQFVVHDEKVVTGIPWTPGQRLLRYTYSIPNEQVSRLWRRHLELPCERVSVRILHDKPDEIVANLPRAAVGASTEEGVTFQQENLAAGDEILVTLGRLPIPWMTYARWTAAAVLFALVLAAFMVLRRSRGNPTTDNADSTTPPSNEPTQPSSTAKIQARVHAKKRRRAA